MDAFFASVEQMDRNLWGVPVVVGSAPDKRGVVSAASYEARKFGIRSAMPSRTAYQKCPSAIFLPVRADRYREISKKIMAIFHSFTPLVEPLSIDEAFMDVTGSLRNFSSAEELGREIKRRVKEEVGLNISIGIAPNKFLAKLASDLEKPDGLTVLPFSKPEIVTFLQPLAINKIWGVGRKTNERLNSLGIKTVKDLQDIDLTFLINYLGHRSAKSLKALAFGEDFRAVETSSVDKSVSNEITLSEDSSDKSLLRNMLSNLIEKVAWRLRQKGLKGRTLRLKIRYADFSNFSKQLTLSENSDVTEVFRQNILPFFDELVIAQPVRLIGFGVASFDEKDANQMTFDFEEDKDLTHEKELDRSLDYIRKNFGSVKRGLR